MCWYCELAAKCITVLLPPTGEILERLDLLEHAALFKSDCCFFYRVYTVQATLESSHWICLLLTHPESSQVCCVVNLLHNENNACISCQAIVNIGIIHFTRWA